MFKKIVNLLIILAVSTMYVSAQKDTALIGSPHFPREAWYEPQPKGMVFIPQGSFKMQKDTAIETISTPSFWMSNEITNKEYREFTDYAIVHPSEMLIWYEWTGSDIKTSVALTKQITYREILNDISVDTLALSKEYKSGDANCSKYRNYFTSPEFDEYPVVGVSFIGARYFCLWKTSKENEINKTKNENLIQDYRIPFLEEWCYAASYCEASKKDPESEIKDVKYYKEGKIKLCNISGNVSEWTSSDPVNPDKRYVKGGSWKDNKGVEQKLLINKQTKSGLVGFRIVRSYGRFKK